MDLDPEGIFLNDSDSDEDLFQEKEPTKDFTVYLVDASPKMFGTAGKLDDETGQPFPRRGANHLGVYQSSDHR
ncbi:hypothetical protein HPP92_015929 [Vanilla planifolia]|uniref:Uncharacterized protein n=1 Tax=Vanilla planifolia TaxID=51239 RepID=A0A835QUI2_VANPL|nr:hypothetical protein HPP92_015929 [Vanilla planifolia]